MSSVELNGSGHRYDDPTVAGVPNRDSESGEQKSVMVQAEKRKSIKRRLWHFVRRYLDPRKRSAQRILIVLFCVIGASLDPLFFYIPMIDFNFRCLKIDRNLAIAAIVFRSLTDLLHLALWRSYSRKEFCKVKGGSSSRGSEAEAEDGFEVLSKKKEITIEIFSILPLSQAATIAILIIKGSPKSPHAIILLKFSVLSQYVIRASRIYPSYRRATVTSPTLRSNHIWFGAAFNLMLYMIAANVIGAFWYLLSVGRYMDCWKRACTVHAGCDMASLYCGNSGGLVDKSYLDNSCPIEQATDTSPFDFGIYLKALQSGVVGTTDFFLKVCFCFSWALRNLSSFGVALDTSAYKWETLFAICVTLAGLVLFALLIGNMQTYLQSQTQAELKYLEDNLGTTGSMGYTEDEWKKTQASLQKLRESLLSYGPFELLPSDLQDQVIGCPKNEWPDMSQGLNLDRMISCVPEELGKKIKRHICLHTLSKVKLFENLDPLSKDLLCKQAKVKVLPAHTRVMKKGTAIEEMVLVVRGRLTYHPADGAARSHQHNDFSDGDFFDLHLRHVSRLSLSQNPPLAVATVKTHTVVEAFTFDMEKVKSVLALATWSS